MEFPDNIQALGNAAQTFVMLHGATLAEDVRDRVIAALGAPSPVDRIVKTGEALYAARADLNEAGKMLVGQLISFAAMNGWHGLAEDNRGGKIVMAMRRDLGEAAPAGGSWPEPEEDPEPLAEFALAETA
jgi:hypothetical protein